MKIVLVQDDERLLKAYETTLQGAGHDVRAFASPERALATLVMSSPDEVDLLVSAANLPGIDGFDLAVSAAQLFGERRPPVVLVAVRPDDQRIHKAPFDSVVHVLTDRATPAELLHVVHGLSAA